MLKAKFEKEGYLVMNDFYSAKQCDTLINRAKEISKQYSSKEGVSVFQTHEQSKTTDDYFLASGNNISFFFEKDAFDKNGNLIHGVENSFNKIGHALHDLDDTFNEFSRSAKLKDLSTEIGFGDHHLIQSMFIFKHAKIGGVVDVHQDSTFLYTEPDSCIGYWFALEDATIDNGCLWAKPGGHKTTLRSRFKRKPEGGTEMEILDYAPFSLEGMIPLEVKKGTCIVLHGLLPHYSLPNTSGKSRPAYSIHTIDPQSFYPKDNWLQREEGLGVKGF
jgi:phytanoyl-CoA hydroxylase